MTRRSARECLHERDDKSLCLAAATVTLTIIPKDMTAWSGDPFTAYRCDDHRRAAQRAFTGGRYNVAIRRLP